MEIFPESQDSVQVALQNDYFALASDEDIGNRLMEKVNEFYRYLDTSGEFIRMAKSYRSYFGKSSTGNGANVTGIQRAGKHNQLSMMKVNHYRNLGQHMLQLTTSQKPVPQPIASNSDAKSHEQAVLAAGLLEYYGREKRVDRVLRNAAEHAIVLGDGYVKTTWRSDVGEENGFDPETNSGLYEGDLEFRTVLALDLIKDPWKESHDDVDWVIVRSFANRFNLAAKWAGADRDKYNSIIGLASKAEEFLKFTIRRLGPSATSSMPTDDVPFYEFFHKKTEAVPKGKYVIFTEGGTILYSGDLPYHDIPIRRIAPAEAIGTPFGYTPLYDMLVLQEAVDALYSAVVTNQMTFGVQLIMAMKGSDIDFRQLAKGLSFIEYSHPQGKPEALNLTHTPAEVFEFIAQLERAMETISGINSTVRGNPEASLKSGSALALVQAQAIQFSSGLQQSYAQIVEDVFTDALNILKVYAKTKRTVAIVGLHNRYMLRSFSSDDLESINRVVVDSGSALSQTTAGRMQIAQDLLNNRLISTPEEYMSVIMTGRLDPMTEGDNRELMNIKEENESLANGKNILVSPVDKHSLHIREHRAVLASPEARSNPAIIRAVADHIRGHVAVLADPAMANLLLILGEQPISAPPPPPEVMAGGTPRGGSAPQPMPAPALKTGGPSPIQLPTLQNKPSEPGFPQNPVTGQKWNPVDGGGAIVPLPPFKPTN